MVRQSFGLVRGSALLTNCFSFAKTCSIGFRSGLYPGRNIMLAPRASMASRTPETFVATQIVGDHDIAWCERWSQELLNPGPEGRPVDRPVQHQRRHDPIIA